MTHRNRHPRSAFTPDASNGCLGIVLTVLVIMAGCVGAAFWIVKPFLPK